MNQIPQSIEAAYQETLDYLYSYVDYSLQRNFRYHPDQFDLKRMYTLMEALGNPQNCYPILHVAGTKGKGSVSALCSAALQAAGYHTGLYTSPHLEDFCERIQVDRQNIPYEALTALVAETRPVIEAIPNLTFFEITTALAYLYFARQKVDVAVIEVGLGGRLDATNVCLPLVSVITSLSYDHMNILGDTLEKIAAEKAGIIKPEIPVIIAPQEPEAMQVLQMIAEQRNAPMTVLGRDFHFSRLSFTLPEQTLCVWAEDQNPGVVLKTPLAGAHQVENAALAYVALRAAAQRGLGGLNDEVIARGFAQTYWPGRFEVLQQNPPLILDCAHNRDSARRLRQTLEDYFPGCLAVMVFGASEDKDISGMLQELSPCIRQLVLVKSFHPRAASLELLTEQAQRLNKPFHIIPDVSQAVQKAVTLVGKDELILVTGSIFVVAGARISWLKNRGVG